MRVALVRNTVAVNEEVDPSEWQQSKYPRTRLAYQTYKAWQDVMHCCYKLLCTGRWPLRERQNTDKHEHTNYLRTSKACNYETLRDTMALNPLPFWLQHWLSAG
jgi:hypothetical protein